MLDQSAQTTTNTIISLRDRFLRSQLSGNRREALRVVVEDGIDQGLSCVEVHTIIREAQREIGRLWQEDRITVAQEHMATAISQVALSHVYQYADTPEPNGKRVLVACVEGEQHEFPARLVADALDLAGFDVRYLGANVPTESLLAMIGECRPDLLVLSATMTFNVPSLQSTVTRVREKVGSALPIAVGGGACTWSRDLARQLGADMTGTSADDLIESARQLLGVES